MPTVPARRALRPSLEVPHSGILREQRVKGPFFVHPAVGTRGDARFYKVDNKCAVCGFHVVTEVCHKKPVAAFAETALMGQVNSRTNLVYLCPNHHAMLDRGIITEEMAPYVGVAPTSLP